MIWPEFQSSDDYFSERFLPQVYEALQDQRLLLLFDEFDVLSEELLAGTIALNTFFPYLQKKLFDEEKLVHILVVGRRLEELTPEFLTTFKQAIARPISFLSRESARRLIREPMLNVIEYDNDAVERIISLTACHPYLTQLVCFELVNYLDSLGKTRVTVTDVNAVIDDVMEAGALGLAWLWDGLPITERFILSAVANVTDENGIATEESINEALRRHRVQLPDIELTQVSDMLVYWGWLERTEERGGYKFIVELLRRWISKEHSLENAKWKKEAVTEYEKAYNLDEIAKDDLIKALLALGEALEEEGRSEESASQYKRVLELSPENRDARERLARLKGAEK